MATVHWVVKSQTQLKQLNRQACNMHIHKYIFAYRGWCFTGGSYGKESACSAGDLSSIPGSGRSFREGNGYSLITVRPKLKLLSGHVTISHVLTTIQFFFLNTDS